jgi:restriction system protein
MGSIHLDSGALFGSMSDIVGIKSGLILNKNNIIEVFRKHDLFEEYWNLEDETALRLDSVTFEEMIQLLLYSVGRLERRENFLPMASLIRKYGKDSEEFLICEKIGQMFIEILDKELDYSNMAPGTKIDPTKFLTKSVDDYGKLGLDIAYEIIQSFNAQFVASPWGTLNQSEWHDEIELQALFEKEELNPQYGKFFDQRYIDYLHRNFKDIDRINWRKFEGLTGEYFEQQGFFVEMGPGRNDDGVDVRVWPSQDEKQKPPTMIIQCKREKRDVSKVVVKSLYADVLHEQAKGGLIVTISRLSPGAKKVSEVRNYPVQAAERNTLRVWLEEMRKPGAGIPY